MKIKLGSWSAYLQMRETIISINEKYRIHFSKDLGAISGLLFEIGSGRYIFEQDAVKFVASLENAQNDNWTKRHQEVVQNILEENEHSEMQAHLAKVGSALVLKS